MAYNLVNVARNCGPLALQAGPFDRSSYGVRYILERVGRQLSILFLGRSCFPILLDLPTLPCITRIILSIVTIVLIIVVTIVLLAIVIVNVITASMRSLILKIFPYIIL